MDSGNDCPTNSRRHRQNLRRTEGGRGGGARLVGYLLMLDNDPQVLSARPSSQKEALETAVRIPTSSFRNLTLPCGREENVRRTSSMQLSLNVWCGSANGLCSR